MILRKTSRQVRWVLAAIAASAALQAQAPPKPVKIGSVTVTGNIRTRIESWDWFQGDADPAYTYLGTLFRLGLGQQTKKLDWQIELAAPVLLGLPDQAIAPGAQGQLGLGAAYFAANNRSRNAGMVFLKQASVRFKGLGGSENHSLRMGRFEFVDGTETTPKDATLAAIKRDRIAHRLVGNFAWSHIGRSLDGIRYAYDHPKTNLTFVAARPTRGVFQVDGWGELDVAMLYGAGTRLVSTGRGAGEARLFVLHYYDWRNVLKADNRAVASRRADQSNIRVTTIGGHYIQTCDTGAGKFDGMFWGAVQAGAWGTLDHRAGSVAVEAGFQPRVQRLRPWIRAGYLHGSGDGDASDGEHNTFFQVLPTPRWYARFPFYNLMNNEDLFGGLILRPHGSVSIRGEVHSLRLANRGDLWYQGGGAFQPWTFGYVGRPGGGHRGLATLFDVSADYQVNSNWGLSFYFAHARGKSVISSIYPDGKNGRLGYVEFTYRF